VTRSAALTAATRVLKEPEATAVSTISVFKRSLDANAIWELNNNENAITSDFILVS
jgi:hypothetical protein